MHGIELLRNNDVYRYAKLALESSPGIMEFGVSRDYGSTKLISDLAITTNSTIKLVDPNKITLEEAALSVNKSISFETICEKGEDVDQDCFKNVGLFHLDGFDIITSHEHKQTTIDAYAHAGIDLLKDGNVHAAQSHYKIAEKVLVSNASKNCVILFDDTWVQNGVWQGKGATAVPMLISNGFFLISKPSRCRFLKQYKWGVALYR
jgi:hypothetical protein